MRQHCHQCQDPGWASEVCTWSSTACRPGLDSPAVWENLQGAALGTADSNTPSGSGKVRPKGVSLLLWLQDRMDFQKEKCTGLSDAIKSSLSLEEKHRRQALAHTHTHTPVYTQPAPRGALPAENSPGDLGVCFLSSTLSPP